MNTALITLDEMRDAVKRAVEERGRDWVYPEEWRCPELGGDNLICRYFNEDGTPSCLIALAFSYLHPGKRLIEGESARMALSHYATREACNYARAAQRAQDCRLTWGEALDAAERYANSLTE